MIRTYRIRGVSAVELLLSIAIVAIAAGAIGRSYSASLDFQSDNGKARDRFNTQVRFEDRLTALIQNANLTGKNSYFISPVPVSDAGIEQHPLDSPLGTGSASLVFTSWGEPLALRYLNAEAQSFEQLNQSFGPQAGNTAIALSTVPVGNPGLKTGLFLREQKPAGSDPKQGGLESLMNADLRDIRFEFYDGTNWQTAWDSTNGQKGKLPTAVRITYLLKSDPQPKELLVSLMLPGGASASTTSGATGQPGVPGSSGNPSSGGMPNGPGGPAPSGQQGATGGGNP